MIQIINLVFGLLWLFKGEMTIGKNKRVKPSVAKGIGAMLILAAIVTAIIPAFDDSGTLSCGIGLFAPVLAIVIGLANAENKSAENKAQTSSQSVSAQKFVVIDSRSDEQKQIARNAQEGLGFDPIIEKLINELVEIGRTDGFISKEPGGKFDENHHHTRAREIGEELNRTGGFILMQKVHYRVGALVTPAIQRGSHPITGSSGSLDLAWNGIGDWRG
uniref:Uncharacterized protein n=1 Tax=candidate division WWE3 bacterium TaxID=2053526 RepID=A0A7C4XU80_UNCKA